MPSLRNPACVALTARFPCSTATRPGASGQQRRPRRTALCGTPFRKDEWGVCGREGERRAGWDVTLSVCSWSAVSEACFYASDLGVIPTFCSSDFERGLCHMITALTDRDTDGGSVAVGAPCGTGTAITHRTCKSRDSNKNPF